MSRKWLAAAIVSGASAAVLAVAAGQPRPEARIWTIGERQKLACEEPFWAPKSASAPGSATFDVADWDGDGLLDFVVKDFIDPEKPDLGYVKMRYVWFRNTGTRTEPRFGKGVELLSRSAKGEGLCLNDWDEDGKMDLVLPGTLNRVALRRGTPDKPEFEIRAIEAEGFNPKEYGTGTAAAIADWDGDGVKDYLGAGGHGKGAGYFFFYRNKGSNQKPVLSAPVKIQAAGANLKAFEPMSCPADVDGDGDPDLVYSVYGGAVFVCENTAGKGKPAALAGPAALTEPAGPIKGGGRFNAIKVADLNGDGVLDLIMVPEGGKDKLWFWPGMKRQ